MILDILQEAKKEELLHYIKINPQLFLKETTDEDLSRAVLNEKVYLRGKSFNYQSILEICEKNPNFDEDFFNVIYSFFSKIKNFGMDSLAPNKDLSLFLTKKNFFNSLEKLSKSKEHHHLINYNSILFASYVFNNDDFKKFKNIINENNILNYKNAVENPAHTGELAKSFQIVRESEDEVKKEKLRSFYDYPETIATIINAAGNSIREEFYEYSQILDFSKMSGLNIFGSDKNTLFFELISKNDAALLINLIETGYNFLNDNKLKNFKEFKKQINKISYKSTQEKDILYLLKMANVQYEKKLLTSVALNPDETVNKLKKRI